MSEWRERSLPAKIENLKKGFQHAKREYSVCFDEFEGPRAADHELEPSSTRPLYLFRRFKSNAPFWRLVLLSETVVFWPSRTQKRAAALGYLFRWRFGTLIVRLATFMKKPYLYVREGQVDVQTRTVTILLMIFGPSSIRT